MPSQRRSVLGSVISLPHGVAFAPCDPPWGRLAGEARSLASLQVSDLPLADLFLIFLAVFVLIGLMPAMQRTVGRIERYLRTLAGEGEGLPAEVQAFPDLYEFEIVVLARLARAGRKGLSLKRLADGLFIGTAVVEQTLASLHSEGLVRTTRTPVAGRRIHLSDRGRDYVRERGLASGYLR